MGCYTETMKLITFIACLLLSLCMLSQPSWAASKRIEVYTLGQNYWDTQLGESLSLIAQMLLPNNANLQKSLMEDIVRLNPDAFDNNDPHSMKANVRLWLPNHITRVDQPVDRKKYRVESYSWGNIKRPRK